MEEVDDCIRDFAGRTQLRLLIWARRALGLALLYLRRSSVCKIHFDLCLHLSSMTPVWSGSLAIQLDSLALAEQDGNRNWLGSFGLLNCFNVSTYCLSPTIGYVYMSHHSYTVLKPIHPSVVSEDNYLTKTFETA